MLRVFIGYDIRQPVAFTVLAASIIANAKQAVSVTPLVIDTLPITRTGLTQFTYSRFLVPWLCGYEGQALFLDADMVANADIEELWKLADPNCGVSVVKKETKFEWPSLMLFNNALCKKLTPEYVQWKNPFDLEDWSEGGIGSLPAEWNYCVGYDHQGDIPKLIHYTAGLPIWQETKDSHLAHVWHKYAHDCLFSVSYNDLMANSVHHKKVVAGHINF